ncbi:MAG: ABC transporter substrate-binding protein [Chroococcales cyanobacterium]
MSQKNETKILFFSLAITILFLGTGIWLFAKFSGFNFGSGQDQSPTVVTPSTESLDERLSSGEEILIQSKITPQKQEAVRAIASGNYDTAVNSLEASLKTSPNDPEALIYLNNARIGEQQAYTIAVSTPIGTNEDAAQEMLRGVAQAQDEINQAGGINGIPLKVVIANDSNDPTVAQSIAAGLVKNSDILGVVGHYASGVTLATADTYNSGQLVAISPISTSVQLSGYSPYVFRTVPSDYMAARALAQYVQQRLNQNKVAVFYNSESAYSQSLKSEFATAMSLGGGEIVDEFDLSVANFNPGDTFNQAVQNGAEAIMLATSAETLDKALQVVAVNRKQIPIVGGDDVYSPKTLQVGGESAEEMIVAIPWHILSNPNSEFAQASRQLWGSEVNWRTALSYDATQALAEAIERNPTREGVQQALKSPNFAAEGASGTVRFLPSGDRNSTVQLVKVAPGDRSSFDYDFVPVLNP